MAGCLNFAKSHFAVPDSGPLGVACSLSLESLSHGLESLSFVFEKTVFYIMSLVLARYLWLWELIYTAEWPFLSVLFLS